MAKILITGVMGTLGRPLKRELERRGHDVWGTDLQHQADQQYFRADVANYRQLERVFEQNYDFVYHLAAEFGRINGEEYSCRPRPYEETLPWEHIFLGVKKDYLWREWQRALELDAQTRDGSLPQEAPVVDPQRALQVAAWR